jgi:hypothetical protein
MPQTQLAPQYENFIQALMGRQGQQGMGGQTGGVMSDYAMRRQSPGGQPQQPSWGTGSPMPNTFAQQPTMNNMVNPQDVQRQIQQYQNTPNGQLNAQYPAGVPADILRQMHSGQGQTMFNPMGGQQMGMRQNGPSYWEAQGIPLSYGNPGANSNMAAESAMQADPRFAQMQAAYLQAQRAAGVDPNEQAVGQLTPQQQAGNDRTASLFQQQNPQLAQFLQQYQQQQRASRGMYGPLQGQTPAPMQGGYAGGGPQIQQRAGGGSMQPLVPGQYIREWEARNGGPMQPWSQQQGGQQQQQQQQQQQPQYPSQISNGYGASPSPPLPQSMTIGGAPQVFSQPSQFSPVPQSAPAMNAYGNPTQSTKWSGSGGWQPGMTR